MRNLTDIEKDVLATCAGVRKRVDIQTLCGLIAQTPGDLEDALEYLERIFLITNWGNGLHSLQPLALSYVSTIIRGKWPTTPEEPLGMSFVVERYCDGLRYWVDFATDTIATDVDVQDKYVNLRNEWYSLKFAANELWELTKLSDESAGYAAEILTDLVKALGDFLQDPDYCSELMPVLRGLGDWFLAHGDPVKAQNHFKQALTLPIDEVLRVHASEELKSIGEDFGWAVVDQPPTIDETYTDLEIHIAPYDIAKGIYAVTAVLDGEGARYGTFQMGETERAALLAIADPEAYGLKLFDALFTEGIKEAYTIAHARAYERAVRALPDEKPEARVRLHLRIHHLVADLHALLWERLHYRSSEGGAFCVTVDANLPFSRFVGLGSDKAAAVVGPVRMLCVIANPENLLQDYELIPLTVEDEIANLRAALDGLLQSGASIAILPGRSGLSDNQTDALKAAGYAILPGPATLGHIQQTLTETPYQIIHLLGHGVYSSSKGHAALLLEGENGQVDEITDEAFQKRLVGLEHKPHLIFLAACESAKCARADYPTEVVNPFVGFASHLVQINIPAVVAMQDKISVKSAQELTRHFYHYLLQHGVVDKALNQARGFLVDAPDWDVPVLFMRLREGRLLQRH